MAQKKYHGSCHCKKVQFEAEIDFSKGTGRCNCTFCTKTRHWGTVIKPEAFKLLSGSEFLNDYTKSTPLQLPLKAAIEPRTTHSFFCRVCGVRPFGMGNIPEIGGDYVSINVASLDDVDFKRVMSSPMQYFDGLNNNWFSTPEYTGHL